MGLDVYVGSLARYYTGNWETKEAGIEVQVDRHGDSRDAIRNPLEVNRLVCEWRDHLSEELKSHLAAPVDWDERPDAPYFTDKPAWDCYSNLLLWAAYQEHPELPRPEKTVEDLRKDPAYQARYTILLMRHRDRCSRR